MEEVNILQISPACPYRLHWSFHCNTHQLLCFFFFELRIPSSCTFPGAKSLRQLSALSRSTTCSFRKCVSIWSYCRSICAYLFLFYCKRERIRKNILRCYKRKDRRKVMEEYNASPAVTDSEPGGKLESWLRWGTPTHKEGAEPSVSATARGRHCEMRGCFVTAKPLSPKRLCLGGY